MITHDDLNKLQTYRGISKGVSLSDEQKRRLKCINLGYLRGLDLPCTLDWYPSDTEDQLNSQKEEHKKYWNNQPPIKYDLNSYGHRCVEIVENPNSIMFLGCSMTFGVGMYKEKTWPAIVANTLGKTEYNLGVPAGSLDSAYRLYKEWQPIAKSSVTILAVPPHYRCEKIVDNEFGTSYQNLGPWSVENNLRDNNIDLAARHLSEDLNDSSMYISFNKNVDAIQKIADDTRSQLILVDYMKLQKIIRTTMGRDGIHPGEVWHSNIAENVLELIGK